MVVLAAAADKSSLLFYLQIMPFDFRYNKEPWKIWDSKELHNMFHRDALAILE